MTPSNPTNKDDHFLTVNELKGLFDEGKIIGCDARVFIRYRGREYVVERVSQFGICGDVTLSIKLSPDGQLFNPREEK